jgi:putative YphP/YqiW family bacilliredoxin
LAHFLSLYGNFVKIFKVQTTNNMASYPEMLVAPMRKELTDNGFTELLTPEEVTNAIENTEGTAFVLVNSVCGCAAGTARPGAIKSLSADKKPAKMFTVFAGMETDAVNKAREYFVPYPPSSPAMALFKDGKLVHFIERHHIEGRSADMIAAHLSEAYKEFC